MEKKLKKQRRKLTLKISAILLAVWLILSCAYAVVAFYSEKEREYDDARIAFSNLVEMLNQPYNSFFAIDEARKTATVEDHTNRNGDFTYSDVSYSYDHDIDVLVIEPVSKYAIDFDDIINITFTAETEDPEYRESHFGYLSFKSFRESMTDEQYDRILYYLDAQPGGEDYYELLCTEFYQNSEDQLLPKTVQIVSTRDVYKWYVQDTEVESFELTPKDVEGLSLYHISYLDRNEIPEEFTRNTFGSGNLIKTAQRLEQENNNAKNGEASSDIGEKLLKFNLSTYIYYDHESVTARLVDYSYEELLEMEENNSFSERGAYDKKYDVFYARRLRILDGCRREILIAAGILFWFFLNIGVILTVMMWRSLKTQLLEEQKRRDMTNALAHDIKTPIFILQGYADNLRDNVRTDKREHYAEVIAEQAREVNRRVNRMLELSKLDSPGFKLNKSEFELTVLIREIIDNYEALPDGKHIAFEDRTSDGKCTLCADRELFKRTVENLVDNAVKYSDPETGIVITVTDLALEVSDVCSSMGKAELRAVMAPFERGDKSRSSSGAAQGTGLGLSIVKTICALHRMKLSDNVCDGIVTFTIKLS